MRLWFTLLFMVVCLYTNAVSTPAVNITPSSPAPQITIPAFVANELLQLSPKDIAKKLGRKLTLKEKIGLVVVKQQVKKQLRKQQREKNDGRTAQTLGILGLVCIFIPYLAIAALPLGILAIVIGARAKRANPEDRKARTGITLGIITLGIFVAALIIVAATLSSFSFG